MISRLSPKFYLLGEPRGGTVVLPFGKTIQITDFHTLDDNEHASGQAIAIYLSRLDAEMHRQYLNRQTSGEKKNDFALIEHSDDRVGIIKRLGCLPCHLVTGFLLDSDTRRLMERDGCYQLMHFRLKARDRQWLLDGASGASPSIMASVDALFAGAGQLDYLSELNALQFLDGDALAAMATDAVRQRCLSTLGQRPVPAVYSPKRRSWITLSVGGRHGTR